MEFGVCGRVGWPRSGKGAGVAEIPPVVRQAGIRAAVVGAVVVRAAEQQNALAATSVDDDAALLDGFDAEPISAAEMVFCEAFGFSACGA